MNYCTYFLLATRQNFGEDDKRDVKRGSQTLDFDLDRAAVILLGSPRNTWWGRLPACLSTGRLEACPTNGRSNAALPLATETNWRGNLLARDLDPLDKETQEKIRWISMVCGPAGQVEFVEWR